MNIAINSIGLEELTNKIMRLKNGEKAIANAINRSLITMRKESSKAIRESYTAKASDIKKTIRLEKASKSNLEGTFYSSGTKISASHFKITPKTDTTGLNKKAVKVEIKKGSKYTVSRGFNWNSNLFRRKGNARLPIKKEMGPSVPQMLENEDVLDSITQKAHETLEKRLAHEYERLTQE